MRSANATNAEASRGASYDEIIADPLFRRGYAEIWRGDVARASLDWSDAEQEAYERGRMFGAWVRHVEEEQVPLVRGGLAHPRARLLLMLAMRDGDVL